MWDEWPGVTPGPDQDPSLSAVGSQTADDSPPFAWGSSVAQARTAGGGWLGRFELALRVTSHAVQKSVFNKMSRFNH